MTPGRTGRQLAGRRVGMRPAGGWADGQPRVGRLVGWRLGPAWVAPACLTQVVRGDGESHARAGAQHPRTESGITELIFAFAEFSQLISCQNSVETGRTAIVPGQPGQNGHALALPGRARRLGVPLAPSLIRGTWRRLVWFTPYGEIWSHA